MNQGGRSRELQRCCRTQLHLAWRTRYYMLFTHVDGRLHQLLVLPQVDRKRMRAIYRRRTFVPLYLKVNHSAAIVYYASRCLRNDLATRY